ncbi:MAG: hypothetical protein WA956_09260 [Stenotrophomonas sp.]
MYPHDTSRRATFRFAFGNVQASRQQAGWHLWLVALLLLAVGTAALASTSTRDAHAGDAPRLSAALPALLDGYPPAPLQPSLHHPGISQADGEHEHHSRSADAAVARWSTRAARNGAAMMPSTASVTPANGQPCRTPPAHAPPAHRHG